MTLARTSILALFLTACAWPARGFTADAPAPAPAPAVSEWRGDGSGVKLDAEPPLEWSDKTSILWKAKVGSGYSCPIVAGDKVLVLSEPDLLTCVNAADGKVDWSKSTAVKDLPEADQKKVIEGTFQSGFAAATPVSDRTNVYIVLANGIVAAYEIKTGNKVWVRVIDTVPVSMEGRSASPIMVDGKLIVHLTDLFALDPKTGKDIWRQPDAISNYATPCAGKIGDVSVIATPNGYLVRASDGKVLATDIASSGYTSPVIKDGLIYFIGTNFTISKLPEKIAGDKADVKEVWSDALEGEVYTSPVIHDGLVYTCTSAGKYFVLDTKAKAKADKQLEIAAGEGGGMGGGTMVYCSMNLAGKNLFVSNTEGKTAVLELGMKIADPKYNTLSDGSGSTPAFVGKKIYMRGGELLYCLGK
ncbi:MAG: PQQ-binding-like beta-propeller repeat protein [Planctomycetes bacterium]|nr:PQQ-binding-like beta-propeller repeat protein [Planctomycetota bacterium]